MQCVGVGKKKNVWVGGGGGIEKGKGKRQQVKK